MIFNEHMLININLKYNESFEWLILTPVVDGTESRGLKISEGQKRVNQLRSKKLAFILAFGFRFLNACGEGPSTQYFRHTHKITLVSSQSLEYDWSV